MRKIIFMLSILGLIAGCMTAYLFGLKEPALPPAFQPPSNPYASGIYAEGIVESEQKSGENVSIYPEVAGTVKEVLVSEGQLVRKGQPLLVIDDSVQRATVEQQHSQWQAALTLLDELRAEPRQETLDVSLAQLNAARASLKTADDERAKQETAYAMNAKAISREALDTAVNADSVARANMEVAQKSYDLTKAGAWNYDIANQEKQAAALEKAWTSSSALLAKYRLNAPRDGVVLAINVTPGSYVSAQGAYDQYTQAAAPLMALGSPQEYLEVRCYVDEILVPRLPGAAKIKAQMSIRGSQVKLPLEFVRVQPYVSPKIELADQRAEKVDLRVLPVIFRFPRPKNLNVYPGILVDVYIGE